MLFRSETLGLLKMDFLGLRNLTVLDDCLEHIQNNRGETVVLEDLEAALGQVRDRVLVRRQPQLAVEVGDLLERRAELAQRLPAYANRFAEIDVNGDGLVSLVELTAFMQKEGLADELRDSERKPPEKAPPPAPDPKREPAVNEPPVKVEPAPAPSPVQETVPQVILQEFAAADRDGNGFLTPDEVRGRFPFIERNFSQVDANGDGRISPLELAQLRKKQLTQKYRP